MTLCQSARGPLYRSLILGAVASFAFVQSNAAHAAHSCSREEGFFPKNNLRYPVSAFESNQLTKAQFDLAIDKVSSVYSPIVTQKGGKFIVDRNWTDNTVNAYAERRGKEYHVAMFGGLARHPLMTTDGFTLVLCHEIGHHLGGAPKYPDELPEGVFMADEGQADYFGNLKCIRRVFEKDDNAKIVAGLGVPKVVTAACAKTFTNANENLICQRSAMAGLTLAKVLEDVSSRASTRRTTPRKIPSFTTPDSTVVTDTFDGHPAAQCRLDTYYAAAICGKEVNDELSDSTAIDGTCTQEKGDKSGFRPLCWFNPKSYNKGFR